MTRQAFAVSETFGIPVMIRLVTRLSHSRSAVVPKPAEGQNELSYGAGKDWTLLPMNARRRFIMLVETQAELVRFSDDWEFNRLELRSSRADIGIIASGIAYNYVMENLKDLEDPPSVLKIACYPLPKGLIRELVEHVDTIAVVEEGYPFIEKNLKGLFGIHGKTVKGKLTGGLPPTGELSPDTVRSILGLEPVGMMLKSGMKLAARPPQLCKGCPHGDTFNVLNAALKRGLMIKQAEVHGMAQRGGAVQSHLRLSSDPIYSDLIPKGRADMILSVEPLETLRYLDYLAPGGRIVTSSTPMINIPNYPDAEEVLSAIREIKGSVIVDSGELAREAGSARAQNIVMLGAASGLLVLEPADLREFIEVLFKTRRQNLADINLKAFERGCNAGSELRN